MEWLIVGDVASVVQITLTLKLIYAIVAAAKTARMHKRNCRQFSSHLKMIAKLLEQLKPQDVEEFPQHRATREPLEQLDLCLKKALVLVENCRDKSYLYLIAMGWSIVAQFKEYQAEIDRYLRLVPLIALVENHKEKLRAIERDRREYTLNEEEKRIYSTLLKDYRTRDDAVVLQRSLSRSYPGLCLERALGEEYEKLSTELQKKQRQMDLDQVDVIEHLLEITKTVNMSEEEREKLAAAPTHSRTSTMESIESGVSVATNYPHGRPVQYPPPPPPPPKVPQNPPPPQVPVGSTETQGTRLPHVPSGRHKPRGSRQPYLPESNDEGIVVGPRLSHPPASNAGSARENDHLAQNPRASHPPASNPGQDRGSGPWDFPKWHNGLYECCMDPFLCISTFLYPCGTFTNIAAVVTDGRISQELACHDLAFHSLYLGCCIYTCCFRRKLRKRFNISGGTCDDCWAHICCCCCALVQEWREVQVREDEGLKLYKMRVPSQQTMENYRPRPNHHNQERYTG